MKKTTTRLLACMLLGGLLGLGNVYAQGPSNDDCTNPIDLTCGQVVQGSTLNAQPSQWSANSRDVWYRVSNIVGPTTVSLCGSTTAWDSYLRVFRPTQSGPACSNFWTQVATGDDDCGLNGIHARATWTAVAGEVYYICVRGAGATLPNWPTEGDFTLGIQCTPAPPANDLCANASPLFCGSTVSGSTVGASPDLGYSSPGVWYTVPGNGGTIVASLCNTVGWDNAITVVQGSCQNTAILAFDDNSCGNSATVSFATQTGITYYILVHGAGTASGNFQLSISCPMPQTPPNDWCINAIPVECDDVIDGTTTGATGPYNSSPDVWYSFVGTGTTVTASLCGSGNYDSWMQVTTPNTGYTGCTDPQWGMGTNDNACGQDAEVTWVAQLGVTYFIRIAGSTISDHGDFTLTITCGTSCAPKNDFCERAIPVVCGGDYSGTTECATADIETGMPWSGTLGVWYVLQGTGSDFVAQTCGGASWDTYIYVYEGSCDFGLNWVTDNDDYCGLQSLVTFSTSPFSTYYIVVGGYRNATGRFNLSITGKDCDEEKPGKMAEASLAAPAELAVTAFPNPSSSKVTFEVDAPKAGAAQMRILDMSGKVVAMRPLGEFSEGRHLISHDWDGVPSGVYLYEIRVGSARATGRVQVLH